MRRILIAALLIGVLAMPETVSASAGSKCTKAGAVDKARGLVCVKKGKGLVWTAIGSPKGNTTANTTVGQAQAAKSAASYLRFSAFSRDGLIKQLEFEGFSNSDATFGVDAQKVDWMAQAAKSAKSYLRFSSFSRSGLISQLLFEGFTQAQAEHGANSVGL
jgi:hypothetical protein